MWTAEGLLSHVEQDTVNVVTPELSSGEGRKDPGYVPRWEPNRPLEELCQDTRRRVRALRETPARLQLALHGQPTPTGPSGWTTRGFLLCPPNPFVHVARPIF